MKMDPKLGFFDKLEEALAGSSDWGSGQLAFITLALNLILE
jgi:hypothetical protein